MAETARTPRGAYAKGVAKREEILRRALEVIAKEMDVTMALTGRTTIDRLDTSMLIPGSYPTGIGPYLPEPGRR